MVKANKKRLLLSLLVLVFAIAIAGTSTYAWFAVNRSVTVSNMQVTIKNDTTYLVIAKSATPITDVADLGTSVTVAANASNAQVLPVRYNDSANPESGYTKWEIARGTDYDDADADTHGYTAVATGDVDNYVVHYTFYVGLTSTTQLPATNLKVIGLTATAVSPASNVFLPAVSAMITCSHVEEVESVPTTITTATVNFENVNSNSVNTPGSGVLLSSTVAKNTVYTIDVYVYINGEHDNVTSENATTANLGAFLLSMELDCTPGTGA